MLIYSVHVGSILESRLEYKQKRVRKNHAGAVLPGQRENLVAVVRDEHGMLVLG